VAIGKTCRESTSRQGEKRSPKAILGGPIGGRSYVSGGGLRVQGNRSVLSQQTGAIVRRIVRGGSGKRRGSKKNRQWSARGQGERRNGHCSRRMALRCRTSDAWGDEVADVDGANDRGKDGGGGSSRVANLHRRGEKAQG